MKASPGFPVTIWGRWSPSLTLLAVAFATLVGCAGYGDRPPGGDELRGQLQEQEQSGYTYGYGAAERPEQARQEAYYQIAGAVVTAIRGEQREVYRLLQRRGEADDSDIELAEELEFQSSISSLSHAVIEGAEVVSEKRSADGWLVSVRVADEQMEQMRSRARRQAPALAQLELIEATPDSRPGLRFQRALSGLATVERLELADERAYIPQHGETTFASYFTEAAREALERIHVVPVIDGTRVRFAVLDRHTLRPQPSLTLNIDGYRLVTDSGGWTDERRVGDLSSAVKVVVEGRERRHRNLLSDEQRLVETLYPRQWREQDVAVLYLHSQPAGAVMRIAGSDYVTPARVELEQGREYRLRIEGTVDYRERDETIRIDSATPAYFYSAGLTERRFGELDLSAEGGALIRLEGYGIESRSIRRPAEAGTYRVRVTRDNPRYQDIVEEIVLREDERIKREYARPPDRFPHYFGWRWGVNLGLYGGDPGDDYSLPVEDGSASFADFAAEDEDISGISRTDASFQLGATAHYFARAMPFVFGAELAYRREQYDVEYSSAGQGGQDDGDDTLDLFNWQGSLGVGFWQPVGMGIGWVTLNKAWQRGSWDDSGADIDMPSGRVDDSYPFIELGGSFDIWGFGVRVSDLDSGPGAMVWFGVGGSQLDGGYQLPAEVEARPGVHY
ncbi:LPP20 family lipoprotein [Halorhodospira halochloris]|uniref:LPP20 family lipoprotein n=1 Tax=Halorhodospira halochloris TaxID=1052 RepID=UPI001EE7CEAD|nr:LPP20 family lipoprotein [Halorhodospira halochloris]MCG5548189.1 LPP20 family lipoprotein [Halorhodospira halochloris]